eukprot:6529214-Prymnesium_polylepis.2
MDPRATVALGLLAVAFCSTELRRSALAAVVDAFAGNGAKGSTERARMRVRARACASVTAELWRAAA